MITEAVIYQALGPLVGSRVYPDTAPDTPAFPFILYQQVGGDELVHLENALASHRNSRMQISIWAKDRAGATSLARQAAAALIAATSCRPIGAFTSLYDDDQKIYGTRQDFSIWHQE